MRLIDEKGEVINYKGINVLSFLTLILKQQRKELGNVQQQRHHITTTSQLTDLGSVASGDIVQGRLDGIGCVLEHAASNSRLTHINHEEIHSRLRRTHLGLVRREKR